MRYLFIVIFVLFSTSIFAQGRPPKEICRELTESCLQVDSQELIDLKELFNSLVDELNRHLGVQADFLIPAVNARFSSFNSRILELESARDALSDPELVQKFQDRIDRTIRNRDKLHAVDEVCFNDDIPPVQISCGSPRDNAKGAGAQISILNQQLNDVQSAINELP